MPYKSWQSLNISEECIRRWASDLNPKTAKNYVYYLTDYIEWAGMNGYWGSAGEILEDFKKLGLEERVKHVEVLESYIKSLDTGSSDRRNRWYAVKSFYEYYGLELPKLPKPRMSRLFKPSEKDMHRSIELKPLEIDEVRKIVLNLPQPYKAALMIVFQAGLGSQEYDIFNESSWRKIVDKLAQPGPLRIDMYRSKVSGKTVQRYYTFIGEDAKSLLREWLSMKPETNLEYLFITFYKKEGRVVPLRSRQLSEALLKTAKKLGLIADNSLGRYHIHLHELRDLFKSLCTLSGVSSVASEFFLGHKIDRLGYDKSPEYDEEWFRREYMKVEPRLNIISNPQSLGSESKIEELKKQAALEAMKRIAETFGIDPVKVKIEKSRKLDRELSLDEEIEILQEEIKKVRSGGSDPKKIISEAELEAYLNDGWSIYTILPSGKIVIQRA